MARNPELDRLRQEALKLHEAATKKVSRLRNVKGVDIGLTEYDPRTARPADIRKMNTRQVRSHMSKLQGFTSRRVTFERGREGVAIPGPKWREYQGVERENRRKGQAYFNSIKDQKLLNGQTIEEYRNQMNPPGFKSVGFTRGNRLYIQGERTPSNVAGVKGLDKIIKDVKMKNSERGPAKAIKAARKNMLDSLQGGGVPDSIVKKAKKLSDYQLDILWHHTSFAQDAGEHYFFNENDGVTPTSSQADRESDLEQQIEWASRLQKPETADPQSTRRRRR